MNDYLGPVKTKRDDLFLKLVKKISKLEYTMHFMEDLREWWNIGSEIVSVRRLLC